ncbi:hypothetical protein [Aquimonas voraii]|uniref:hypothetical protein n=1 Tax=Aquimonas voraii TaxID=265719 RepID=UPI00115FECC4|nr:hypothetical protein [Aquimonas voraii]
MKLLRMLLAILIALPLMVSARDLGSGGAPESGGTVAAENDQRTEAEALLDEIELSMNMARDGQYGRIKKRDMDRLESAFAHIVEVLGMVERVSELPAEKQQSLASAQSQINDVLKPEDEDRKICKRISSTGTRLGALECLTLAERRSRAEAFRNMVDGMQRGACVPGEGRPCPG